MPDDEIVVEVDEEFAGTPPETVVFEHVGGGRTRYRRVEVDGDE